MSLTADGVFTMGSGLGNIDDLGLMTAWNYRNRSVYPGECGRIHGTYGEEFPPNSVYQSDITLYANDLCSVLNLKRQKASSVRGIPSVLFAGGPDVFSNETTCYCRNSSNCPASGVRDLSLCNGSPAMVSWPHFYLADPSYRKAVVGMNPDAEHHQFYMDMAEVTSVPLAVRGRMQLNILMQTVPDIDMFKNISWTVMPMMWFSQEADLTPELASQMGVLVGLVNWGRWVLLGGGVVGVLLVLLGLVLHFRGTLRTNDDDRLLH
ncbi:protein croquemort-like isoform X1 [Homalodisca vitripennis]|nr:protein croquemort-like isoform X1 [Homalodisca vitripennis]KAG8256131.1 hypothetical protein J6590_076015 [Homalodisca vitripennis]